jgi:sarcosine oxidase gamma subunit
VAPPPRIGQRDAVSRTHPEQWTVRAGAPRADPDLVAAFAALPTTQFADSGGPVGVLALGPGPVAVLARGAHPATGSLKDGPGALASR